MSANWAYALSQGGAAGAASAVGGIDRQIKEDSDIRAENRKLDLYQRQKAIDESMLIRAEDRKRARAAQMGSEIDTEATAQRSAADAGSINANLGSSIDPTNAESARQLAAIRANPAAMKAYALVDEGEVGDSKYKSAAAKKLGYTDAAKEEDVTRRNLIADKRSENRDEREKERNDRLDKLAETRQKQMESHESFMRASQARLEKASNEHAKTAEANAQRSATAKALDGVRDEVKAWEKEATDMNNADATNQARIKAGLADARERGARLSRTLEMNGLPGEQGPPTPKTYPTAPQGAIDALKKDPQRAGEFDAKFGPGASKSVLGGATSTPAANSSPAAKAKPLITDDTADTSAAAPAGAERVAVDLEQAKRELAGLGNPPPGRDAQALAAWRAKRDAVQKRVDDLTKQYQDALGPIGAYFGARA